MRARPATGDRRRAAGLWTLAGLAVAGVLALALFVGPEWSEYRFYNWQMSVTRKPSYDAQSLLNRVSWFPVLHDVLSRMWIVVALGLAAFVARALDWLRRPPAEQLLALWIGVGVLELLLHDVGNERRFVFLIPALTALAALALGRRSRHRAGLAGAAARLAARWPWCRWRSTPPTSSRDRWSAWPSSTRCGRRCAPAPRSRSPRPRLAWLFRQRLAAGRPPALDAGGRGDPGRDPRPSAASASSPSSPAGRTYANVEASRELARRLPPGTLVHGKLANGLALENRIRPHLRRPQASAITKTASRGTMYHGC